MYSSTEWFNNFTALILSCLLRTGGILTAFVSCAMSNFKLKWLGTWIHVCINYNYQIIYGFTQHYFTVNQLTFASNDPNLLLQHILYLLTCSTLGPSRHPDLSSIQSVEYSSLSCSLLPPYWLSSPAYPDQLFSGWAAIFLYARLPASFPWCPGSLYLYTKFPVRTFLQLAWLFLLSLPVATKNVTDLEYLQPGDTSLQPEIFVFKFQ